MNEFDHAPPAPMESTKNLSRRTIVKASAWAVPAVAIAVSAPRAAASTNGPENSLDPNLNAWIDYAGDVVLAGGGAITSYYRGAPAYAAPGAYTFYIIVFNRGTEQIDPGFTVAARIPNDQNADRVAADIEFVSIWDEHTTATNITEANIVPFSEGFLPGDSVDAGFQRTWMITQPLLPQTQLTMICRIVVAERTPESIGVDPFSRGRVFAVSALPPGVDGPNKGTDAPSPVMGEQDAGASWWFDYTGPTIPL